MLCYVLQICDAKDTTELCDLLMEDDARYIGACGILKPVFRVTTRDIPEITEAVCIEYLIMKSINELNQFQEGLNILGVSDLIKDHPASCHELFVHCSKTVTPHDIDELFLPLFSPEGSNAREDEEALILNWKDYIYEAEGYLAAICYTFKSCLLFYRVRSQFNSDIGVCHWSIPSTSNGISYPSNDYIYH